MKGIIADCGFSSEKDIISTVRMSYFVDMESYRKTVAEFIEKI